MMLALHLRRSYSIDEEKEGDHALPPEEGEGLQDTVAGCPGEPPPTLQKPLKMYPPLSDLKRPPQRHLCLRLPTLPPKPPRVLPKAEKDKEIFLKKIKLLKQNLLLAENPLGGCLTQGKIKKREKKRKREKEEKKRNKKKNIRNKKDFTNAKFLLRPNRTFFAKMSC